MGGLQSFYTFFKEILLTDEVIIYLARDVVTGWILRPASQGIAQVDIPDVLLMEAAMKGLTVILGIEF